MFQQFRDELDRLLRWGRGLTVGTVVLGASTGLAALLFQWFRSHPEQVPRELWNDSGPLILFLTLTGLLLFSGVAAALWAILGRLRSLQSQLGEVAVTDPLTGAYNRYRLIEELSQLQEERSRYGEPDFALLMLDLDHFKSVNDNHGHQVGDRILRRFVARLRPLLRATDSIYRYGGEEFVVLAPHTDPGEGLQLARRLHRAIADTPFDGGDVAIPMTVSIGVAGAPPLGPGVGVQELIDAADRAMYEAKRQGRNRVVWYEDAGDHPARREG